MDSSILKALGPKLPAAALVMIIEHISIGKSFGRVNNYSINPSTELLSIGAANIVGSFFGAYLPAGAFSRTAVNSKAGSRTPFAGVMYALYLSFDSFILDWVANV